MAFSSCRKFAQAVESFSMANDLIMTIRICAKSLKITVVQGYAPTSIAMELEIEGFYSSTENILKEMSKKDIMHTLGDFNANIYSPAETGITGSFELADRRLQLLITHSLPLCLALRSIVLFASVCI